MTELLNVNDYKFLSWKNKYEEEKEVSFGDIKLHFSWNEFASKRKNMMRIKKIEKYLSENKANIYPYPDLVFNAFNMTPLEKVKVLFLGQDPYFKNEVHNNKIIPQAMGLSFAVPIGMKIPSSLENMYRNLIKFGHMKQENKPNHGNLSFWAYQGCLMLNTALTVHHNDKNSHMNTWKKFTDHVIEYISDKLDHVIFVLWGAYALTKLNLINDKKHTVLISSHPSGLSYAQAFGPSKKYKAFCDVDHFGLINEDLEKHGKTPIIWRIPNYIKNN